MHFKKWSKEIFLGLGKKIEAIFWEFTLEDSSYLYDEWS